MPFGKCCKSRCVVYVPTVQPPGTLRVYLSRLTALPFFVGVLTAAHIPSPVCTRDQAEKHQLLE
eukprot:6508301-Pyramimonas_sp.AAC.1